MSAGPPRRMLRLAERVLRVLLRPATAAAIAGDLQEEVSRSVHRRRFPRLWVAGQVVRHLGARFWLAAERGANGALAWREARYAFRQWRRHPATAAFIVLLLGAAIGADTTFLTIIDGLRWRPLPVEQPDRLVSLSLVDQQGGTPRITPALLREIEARQRGFTAVCGYLGTGDMAVDAGGSFFETPAAFVTGSFFEVVGGQARLGRLIQPSDVGRRPSATAQVAVISTVFWQRAFHSAADVIGRYIRVEGVPFTVIGVAPQGFTGLQIETATDVFLPAPALATIFKDGDAENYGAFSNAVGRLRDSVSLAAARAQLQARWPDIASAAEGGAEPPHPQRRLVVSSATTGFSYLRSRYAPLLRLLAGLAVWMILIACVSVGGVLGAAALRRSQEFQIRLALGASRTDVVRQLLFESAIVSVAGAALGLAAGDEAAGPLLARFSAYANLNNVRLDVDWRLAALTAATAIGVSLLVALVPAVIAVGGSRATVPLSIRTASRARHRWEPAVLVGQLALSLILIVGAGLFARTLLRLQPIGHDRGLQDELLVTLRPNPSAIVEAEDATYARRLVDQLQAVPGVTAAALGPGPYTGTEHPPTSLVAPIPAAVGAGAPATTVWISPGFAAAVGATVLQGRDLSWADAPSHPVVLLSASLAAQLSPTGEAVGRRVRLAASPMAPAVDADVVGVVADRAYEDVRDPNLFVVYRSHTTVEIATAGWWTAVVHLTGPGAVTDQVLSRTVAALGQQMVSRVRSFAQEDDAGLFRERLAATLGGFFAALAGLLAAVGVYARLSQSVAERRREIGIRLALGAAPRAIHASILGRVLRTVGWAAAVGLPASLPLATLASRQLDGLTAFDPLVLGGALLTLAALVVAASWRPATLAARTDPIEALRSQ